MTTFTRAAMISLDNMKTVWKSGDAFRHSNGGCFWMAGNFFQTALEAMFNVGVKDSYGFGLDALKFFDEKKPKDSDPRKWPFTSGIWVDDYGWWGIALIHAYRFADRLGYDAGTKQIFGDRAKDCWEAMNAFWQTSAVTWETPDKKSHSITGGVPNTLNGGTLAGRNCVTNEVYWALSNLLTVEFGNHYSDPKALASDFFKQGFDQGILQKSNNLVYERFYYMPGSTQHDWTWLGDQGLFAYSAYNNKTGNQQIFGSKIAELILKSVIQNSKTANGVLHEDLAPWPEYIMDYACGKGTFVRYLGAINSAESQYGNAEYNAFLANSARAVWKNRNQKTGLFGFYWDNEQTPPDNWGYPQDTADAILQAAGLSVIVAALLGSANQPIDQAAVTAGAV